MKATEIKLNPDNPRTIEDDKFQKLVKSLRDFPEMAIVRPVVINQDNMILGGNMRYRAMLEAGWEDIPVTQVKGWTKEQEREFIIKDNVSGGEWDWGTLRDDWDTEFLEDWGLDVPPLVEDYEDVEEDEAPRVATTPPVSKLGEIYQLGRHRVMCGDSINYENVSLLMDGKKAAMYNSDPPYNVDYTGKTKDALKIQGDDFDTNQEFYDFLVSAISSIKPFVSGDVYICMSSSELHTLQKAFTECGGHWSTFIIWVKNQFTLGRSNYHRQYEPILYGWFDGSSHHWSGNRKLADVYKEEPTVDGFGRAMLYADGLNTDVWEFDRPTSSREHPTMKPIKLCARAIVNSSKPKDIVLDTFLGSGSTLIACEQTDRICYGIEIDPRYMDVIRKRYAKFIGEEDWEAATPVLSGK